jgi:deoxyxylulose-5-phosphate synthase
VTVARQQSGARAAILAMGAPAFVAIAASEVATTAGVPTDVYIVNGLPLDEGFLGGIAERYTHVATIEDGLIGSPASGLRGMAGLVASELGPRQVRLNHFGISDPQIAPSDAYLQVWEHFGMTEGALTECLLSNVTP